MKDEEFAKFAFALLIVAMLSAKVTAMQQLHPCLDCGFSLEICCRSSTTPLVLGCKKREQCPCGQQCSKHEECKDQCGENQ